MNKKNLFDTSKLQDVQWGNIELPGLTDDKLHSTNWNMVDALKERSKSSWKINHTKAVKKFKSDPIHRKTISEQMRKDRGYKVICIEPNGTKHKFNSVAECAEMLEEPYFSSAGRKLFPESGEMHIVTRRRFKNWIFYRPIPKINQQALLKEAQQKVELKINPPKKVRNIEAWKEKMSQWRSQNLTKMKNISSQNAYNMGKKNSKPLMTPDGRFDSARDAARFYKISPATMYERIKKKPDKYYYI